MNNWQTQSVHRTTTLIGSLHLACVTLSACGYLLCRSIQAGQEGLAIRSKVAELSAWPALAAVDAATFCKKYLSFFTLEDVEHGTVLFTQGTLRLGALPSCCTCCADHSWAPAIALWLASWVAAVVLD